MDVPPMFDISGLDIWNIRMSVYLKALGLHVYLATINISFFSNDKYLGANAQIIDTFKQKLSKK